MSGLADRDPNIDIAIGIIMATTGCDADDAFGVLRDQSQHENRKLRLIATETVERHTRRFKTIAC